MIGICHTTGRMLTGWALFMALASDALTTALGSREKRRDYGSRLPELLARTSGDDLLMLAQAYAAEAIVHPPNQLSHLFSVRQVRAIRHGSGLRLVIAGDYNGQAVTFEVPIHADRP